jgi:hypothetical protein
MGGTAPLFDLYQLVITRTAVYLTLCTNRKTRRLRKSQHWYKGNRGQTRQ